MPAFFVGQKVRKILNKTNSFGTRGFEKRFSDEIYTIDKITKTLPYGYFLKEDKSPRFYYSEELADVVSNTQDQEPLIESISSSRERIESTLRSGKPKSKITEFLCSIQGESQRKYLTESEIKQYKNGASILKKFQKDQDG